MHSPLPVFHHSSAASVPPPFCPFPPLPFQELLAELMGWGVTPALEHYEHIMEAYALHRDLAAAEGVLDRLAAAGHSPVLRTYNRLLHGVAINGDLVAAMRVYDRLRLQGLQPDMQTMRGLFKTVRLYASLVRVLTARKLGQLRAERWAGWIHTRVGRGVGWHLLLPSAMDVCVCMRSLAACGFVRVLLCLPQVPAQAFAV